jgi:hypothetical protein
VGYRKYLEVFSKPHLTPNPPKAYPPQAGGKLRCCGPPRSVSGGPAPDTENIRSYMRRFPSAQALHLTVI